MDTKGYGYRQVGPDHGGLTLGRPRIQDAPLGRDAWRLRVVVVLSFAVVLATISILLSPLWMCLLLLGGILVWGGLKQPALAILAMIAITSTVVYEKDLPLIPVPVIGLHLHVTDIAILGMLGLIVLRWLAEPDFRFVRSPLDIPLIAFYGVALGATALALVRSTGAEFAFREIWVVTYYLILLVVTNLVRSYSQLRLLMKGLDVLALLVAAAMVIQFALGQSTSLLAGRVETLRTQDVSYEDITRIIPPGQSLVLVVFIALGVRLAINDLRWKNITTLFGWGLLGFGVLLTFNRAYWAVAIGAFLLLALITGRAERRRLMMIGALAVSVVLIVALSVKIAAPQSRVARLVDATATRFATLGSSDTIEESSVRFRFVEWQYALSQIERHPLFGLGLGARYRPTDTRLDSADFDGRRYIHNGHLYVILKTGLVGYSLLAFLSFLFVVLGFTHWRKLPEVDMRGRYLGFTLAYLAASVAALSSPVHMEYFWTPLIGLIMGANMVILRLASISCPESSSISLDTVGNGE